MNGLAQAYRAAAAERLLAGDALQAARYLHEAHLLELLVRESEPQQSGAAQGKLTPREPRR